jgi:hypothetical protein
MTVIFSEYSALRFLKAPSPRGEGRGTLSDYSQNGYYSGVIPLNIII